MQQLPAKSLSEATSELVAAYRATRRAADKLPPLRRTGVVAQLADSSAAAHRALEVRHNEPGAAHALLQIHQALAGDDWLVRLNRWRGQLFVVLGIQAVTVVGLMLSIVFTVGRLGREVLILGADRGVVVIAFALMVFCIQAWDRYHSWDKKIDRPTMDALRTAERTFYASTGGRPPLVHRDQGLRFAVVLLPSTAWFVAWLLIGWIVISLTQNS
jgi:hypothetical protein